MIINKLFKCPVCGKTVEGIRDYTGDFRCYCSQCHDWWHEKEDKGILMPTCRTKSRIGGEI